MTHLTQLKEELQKLPITSFEVNQYLKGLTPQMIGLQFGSLVQNQKQVSTRLSFTMPESYYSVTSIEQK